MDLTPEQYRALIEQSSDAISVVAADGTIRYQSSNSEHVKGWKPEELRGENILEYVHPEDRARVLERFGSLTEGSGVIEETVEFRFETKSDGWIWLEVTGTAPGEESPIDGYITTSRDITERKERERELERRRVRVQVLFEEAPDSIIMHDANGEILDVNEQTVTDLGYPREQLLSMNIAEFERGHTIDDLRSLWAEMDSDDRRKLQSEHERRDGSVYPVEIWVSRLEIDGESRFLAMFRDITERKNYEEELEDQRDNLEVLNQVVRHDIRNALQLVVGYAQTLDGHVDEDGEESLEQIRKAARDAIDITTTARDVTQVMLGSDSDRQPVRLRPVLESEVENLRSSYEHARVRIDGRIPDVEVLADDMLESVVRNLLTNGIQHNDKQSPEAVVSAACDDETVRIRIADNGPGIPEGRKEEIFEQGQKDLDSEGTGLGLYLVDTLVDRYGGHVRVEDNDPEGAVFIVELPVAADASPISSR